MTDPALGSRQETGESEQVPDTTPPDRDGPGRSPTAERTEPTIGQLYDELQSDGVAPDTRDVRLAPDQRSEVILDRVLTELFGEADFRFRDSTVKSNLDEILLSLVAHRSSGTHGKSLMEDLATVFDTHVSPGTLYPRLHELEDDGLLHVQELVRRKEYQVDDEEALAERVTAAMEQHLVLGLFFRTALAEL